MLDAAHGQYVQDSQQCQWELHCGRVKKIRHLLDKKNALFIEIIISITIEPTDPDSKQGTGMQGALCMHKLKSNLDVLLLK